MKKNKFFKQFFLGLLLSLLLSHTLYSQGLKGKPLADSLLQELPKTKIDTDKVKLLIKVVKTLTAIDPSSAMHYVDTAMKLARQYQWPKGIGMAYLNRARISGAASDFATSLEDALKARDIFISIQWKAATGETLAVISNDYQELGDYTKALDNNFKGLSIYEEIKAEANIAWTYNNIGANYYWLNNYPKAIEYYNKALVLQRKLNDKFGIGSALDNIASVYEDQGDLDKVNEYNLQAIALFKETDNQPGLGRIYINRGNLMQKEKNFDSAIIFYKQAITIAQKLDIKPTLAFGIGGIGDLYINVAKDGADKYTIPDSFRLNKATLLQKAHNYYSAALALSTEDAGLSLMMQFAKSLSEVEALRGNYKTSLDFYKQYTTYKDSIFNDDNKTKIATLENQRLAEVKDKEIQLLNKESALRISEQEKKDANAKRIKNVQYFTIAGLAVIILAVIIIASIQYRSSRHKQKANELLESQKQKVENTLTELKSTQSQLIQSEKMASLGELTAGIAHEIQNPLNFVNNFSEVNKELLEELREEASKGNMDEVKAIANDLIENEEKINHHGKRADSIVKGMLLHSRQTKGVKEMTDVNALCDEYVRLSYHGLRAKDKSFNADIKTDFDAGIGKVNIVPQEIGRVLLNLYTNAFYSLNEKAKQHTNGYAPTIFVSTKKSNGIVQLMVKDNGNGIPQSVLDKIFQPFFTTKPTGQGTGLGLSISYDIVKAHGGVIKVETKEGEGTEFIITLPVT